MSIIDLLNAREHLELYGKIKYLKNLYPEVDNLLEGMNLLMNGDTIAGGFSGGNKRKLMVAIAMIAQPKVLFLDEPSTGLDPESKRFMWNSIKSYKKNCSIVLTTHSMGEAENLADNLVVMKDGLFKAYGNINYIKSKFSQGIYIDLMFKQYKSD